MKKLAPQISLIIWSVWLSIEIVRTILNPADFLSGNMLLIASDIGSLGAKGGGIVLSLFLCRQPKPGLAFLLTGLSLFAFWKFCLGGIVSYMLPELGGLSFNASIIEWWKRSTRSVAGALLDLPFCFFIIISLIFWPIYGLLIRSSNEEAPNHKR